MAKIQILKRLEKLETIYQETSGTLKKDFGKPEEEYINLSKGGDMEL